ncbi:MAG: ATPase, T2SS/T4P/T4SS family [Eubacterium sp.]|nr:ATPase, T2SS/T4P/T4SS family [Eubacterium sp.]
MRKRLEEYLPVYFRRMYEEQKKAGVISEMRVHLGGMVTWVSQGKKYITPGQQPLGQEEFGRLLSGLCEDSMYAYEEEIKRGFFTLPGGHRVGVSGQVQTEQGKILTMSHITSLNIRIAHEINGCGGKILPQLMCGDWFLSTLIVSPPACGKTTLLRDLIRILAGDKWRVQVGLVDERSEVAGGQQGEPVLDVGIFCDVIDGCKKAQGIRRMIRSMAPEIIAVDEIGGREDMEALQEAAHSGCQILATIHGRDFSDLLGRAGVKEWLSASGIQRVVVLQPFVSGENIREILDEKGEAVK